jgi:hypothetical protein
MQISKKKIKITCKPLLGATKNYVIFPRVADESGSLCVHMLCCVYVLPEQCCATVPCCSLILSISLSQQS